MEHALFALVTVLPVFFVILLGSLLRSRGVIDARFVTVSSRLVFTVSLPALIFSTIAVTDFFAIFDWREVAVVAAITVLVYAVSNTAARLRISGPASRGAFVACSINGNVAILGLAIISSVFGESGLARGAVLLSFMMPLYNGLTVMGLLHQVRGGDGQGTGTGPMIVRLLTNPLILAAVAALPFSLSPLAVPELVLRAILYLAQMTLPLALLGIGASLRFDLLRTGWRLALGASFLKIIVMPLLAGGAAMAAGLPGTSVGMIILFTGTPTAVASFIMSESMGADAPLAASIITFNTLAAVFTMGGAIFLFRVFGWV